MRKWFALLGLLTTVISVEGASYTFIPSDPDVFDLDHHNAYAWGISTASGDGQRLKTDLTNGLVITGATIRFKDIWDWTAAQDDTLYINLLNDPKLGLNTIVDNSSDTQNGNYFGGSSPTSGDVRWSSSFLLQAWHDPNGGVSTTLDYVYSFDPVGSPSELARLTAFILDSTAYNRAGFGIGFDPDCHYYNNGIEFCITTGTVPTQTSTVPDGGSTAMMLGLTLMGAGALHARLRKARLSVA